MTDEIKIDKGVPLPDDLRAQRNSPFTIAVRKMEPGDSIWLPKERKKNQMANARLVMKRMGIPDARFTSREIIFDKEKGLRLWRVK